MSDFLCPFCLHSFSCDLKVLHILPCYRAYMFKNKAVPYCTCNRCLGARTHPGDNADGSYNPEDPDSSGQTRKHELLLPAIDVKKSKQETSTAPALSNCNNAPEIHLHQRTGGQCLICDIKKSPSAVHVPFIYLGRFSEFMICKKQHILDEQDVKLLMKRLTMAWTQIEKDGSDEPNAIFYDSQEDVPAPVQHSCIGYQSLDGSEMCGKSCTIPLFFDLNNPHWFCKPSHLVRYLAYNYGK